MDNKGLFPYVKNYLKHQKKKQGQTLVDPRDRKELHPYMIPLTKDPGIFLFFVIFLFSDRKEPHLYMISLTKDPGIMYMYTHTNTHTHTHTHQHGHEIQQK